MKKISSVFRVFFLLLLTAGMSFAARSSSQAAELDFPSIDLSANSTALYTTSTTSTLGTLLNPAVLQFTTSGVSQAQFSVTITVPSGDTFTYQNPLLGAPYREGTYTGLINFPNGTMPGSGLYTLGFQSGFRSISPIITGISLTVTPTAVPEPSTWALLAAGGGVAATAGLRRRRTSQSVP